MVTLLAIPLLEQAAKRMQQIRFPQLQGWLSTWWSEAYCQRGELVQAHDLARQALIVTTDIKNCWGVGLAQRALGRIALASGILAEATTYLQEALQTFTEIHANFEAGRTH